MCGIAGIINKTRLSNNVESLISMTNSMINRGPDDEGYMLSNENTTSFIGNDSLIKNHKHINTAIDYKFKVAFGFRQLKIIDFIK